MYVRIHYACWLVSNKTGPDGWQVEEGAGVLIVHKTERIIMWPCCDHRVTCLLLEAMISIAECCCSSTLNSPSRDGSIKY